MCAVEPASTPTGATTAAVLRIIGRRGDTLAKAILVGKLAAPDKSADYGRYGSRPLRCLYEGLCTCS
ncbi:MAG: hypothetical protein QOG75_4031 [Mycobacterium sp.]|nr:hypothetical protein [Mycobacterium sp.]